MNSPLPTPIFRSMAKPRRWLVMGGGIWLCACGTDQRRPSSENGDTGSVVDLTQVTEVDPLAQQDGVPESSRLPRLTYEEYDAVVSELLSMPVASSRLFPTEDATLGAYEERPRMTVNDRLITELRAAAEELAERFVTTPEAYGKYISCKPDDACRDAFLEEFSLRAYRRPATEDELQRLTRLFDSAGDLLDSGDAFRDGVQLVVEAVLQSAKLLYQVEQGAGVMSDAGEELSDYELASRLSFALWGRMPDQELFDEAEAGTLRQNLEQQVERMLASPQLKSRVNAFHERWLHLEAALSSAKDATLFPTFTEELALDMGIETRSFIQEITLARDGGIRQLLTSPIAFLNDSLATHYGLPTGYGTEHAPTSFSPDSGRIGLLTQGSFLVGHASSTRRTSPILRGAFLHRRVLCNEIPNPPPGSEMQEPEEPLGSGAVTTRAFFEWKTSAAGCDTCHDQINPLGFAFEQFDAVGRIRSEEAGAPIDASGNLSVHNRNFVFASAAEAIEDIAQHPVVRACYAKQWLNYVYGRSEAPEDLRTLAYASQGLDSPEYGVRGILTAIAEGSAFSHLSPIVD